MVLLSQYGTVPCMILHVAEFSGVFDFLNMGWILRSAQIGSKILIN
jgi:hypothetical protein